MLKKANNFFVLPCFSLGYLDEMNHQQYKQQFYWNLHYYNFCINVSHICTCIPNEEVGGARNV